MIAASNKINFITHSVLNYKSL